MDPREYCHNKATPPGSSLYYSLLFLPEAQRHTVTALYAYQKEIVGIVAECSDVGVAQTKLQWWQEEITRLFAGCPRHPVTQTLATPIKTYDLPQQSFLQVIGGAASDLEQSTYPSFQALTTYCYQIAGVISLMAAEIYGYQDSETRTYAENLGIALQLTHILRNVRQDADRGRIYLPQEELTRFQVSSEAIFTSYANSQGMTALLAQQAGQTRHYFRSALANLGKHDRQTQYAGLTQIALGLNILNTMEEDGYPVLQRRTSLTPLRKLWIAWRTSRRARRGLVPQC
ncbi:Squalene/phytoene synthase [Nitrosococcus oceani ATCC 19707]|uniref:Squalene/phytoene synthase n=2 Tax=Nitrosococcus oceani TaxID=1229 RepID=Q3JC96_NITOC|nr:presqualene diphosphate synthase HpnD [Nitrosococcus oceani]ABA57550.1 Squalene/phytoene synthase [Nitrosococcus oceani ATCC 19707]EDZ67353.1 Squalene and phytoene synthases superfamily [Nitrosococcus oceani AFC27]KFI20050.1 phytoene synthase [Nitrosococcus oceani C-27]GEM20661.1 squalene synthase HpnD [Nitrosococcus oceani]